MIASQKITIDIPIELKSLLDKKIELGHFESISDFVQHAANEYLALEFDIATQKKILEGIATAECNEKAVHPISVAFDRLDKIHLDRINSAA